MLGSCVVSPLFQGLPFHLLLCKQKKSISKMFVPECLRRNLLSNKKD